MITVIYSTHKDEQYNDKFKQHLLQTVGLKNVQILEYTNYNQYSLSEIYNKGILESENDIVVCCHNDIKLEKNWGKKLLNHFKKETHDIIGVAGTTYFPKSSVWWEFTKSMKGIVKHSHNGKTWESKYSDSQGYDIKDVVILDGLFLSFNKKNITHNFDESFDGFHFYDLGFCFPNFLNQVKLGVVTDIKITHMSIGQTNQQWEENRVKFFQKYSDELIKNNGVSCLPLVSIVIPCYNDGEYLRESINSAKGLIYPNKEIIIINDGSTDINTNNICKELENDNELIILYHDKNKGLSAARNTGIEKSKGYYILPHDVDDTFENTFLLHSVEEAERNLKISPVYCDTNHSGFIQGVEQRPEWSKARLKQGPFIVSNSLFRKHIWEELGGYDETMTGWEDYDFWWRMANKGYIGVRIPLPLFNYRHIRQSMIQDIKNKEQELYNYIMSKK